jgi:hypothetical protein
MAALGTGALCRDATSEGPSSTRRVLVLRGAETTQTLGPPSQARSSRRLRPARPSGNAGETLTRSAGARQRQHANARGTVEGAHARVLGRTIPPFRGRQAPVNPRHNPASHGACPALAALRGRAVAANYPSWPVPTAWARRRHFAWARNNNLFESSMVDAITCLDCPADPELQRWLLPAGKASRSTGHMRVARVLQQVLQHHTIPCTLFIINNLSRTIGSENSFPPPPNAV